MLVLPAEPLSWIPQWGRVWGAVTPITGGRVAELPGLEAASWDASQGICTATWSSRLAAGRSNSAPTVRTAWPLVCPPQRRAGHRPPLLPGEGD